MVILDPLYINLLHYYCRLCNLSWRCHNGQQHTNSKCRSLLGSSNFSNKRERNTMVHCDDAPFVWPMQWFSSTGILQLICPAANISDSGGKHCSFRGTLHLEMMNNEIQYNSLSFFKSGLSYLWPSVSNYVLNFHHQVTLKSQWRQCTWILVVDHIQRYYPVPKQNGSSAHLSRVPEIIFWHIPSQAYKRVAPRVFKGVWVQCLRRVFLPKKLKWA